MYYSIGEVSEQTGIAISTLRYYDKEGFFPAMNRTNGRIRRFSDTELSAIRVIECLKSSGLSIKDIKRFMDWTTEGDATLLQRRELFYQSLETVKEQLGELEQTMTMLKYKCWYYDTALALGSESAVKSMTPEEFPVDIRECAKAFHAPVI